MTEERDPFREYVEQEVGNKKWKCKLCGGEFAGRTSRILPHLAGIRRQNIRPCEKVDHEVKEEASRVFYRKRKTSGAGTEGTVSGASQSVAPSEGASNPNDVQNSNRPGCAPQQPSFDPPTGTGTAPAGPQDQEPLRSSMPQHLIDLFASPSLDISALLEFPEQSSHGVIMPDAPLYSDQPNLDDLLSEDFDESLAKFLFSEEREADELHNPAVVSSLQIDSSLDVDGENRLQGCGQPRGVEVVPDPSNRSPTNIVQQSGQLPPRCDKEDGNDIRRFPSPTQMEIDPSSASLHTSDFHILEATIVDSLVVEASTDTLVPSPSHALVPPSSSRAPHNASPPPRILSYGTAVVGPSSLPESDMNEGAPVTSHPSIGNDFEENRALKRKLLFSKEAIIRDELQFAESLSLKKRRMEVVNWLANVEKLRNYCTEAASEDCLPPHQQVDTLMHEVEDFTRQGKGLFEARETKLLEDEMVGEAFQRNTKKILDYLVGNQISRLGIYGMGGVGKTTIMLHIHNGLDNVLWITVSQDFSIQTLQDDLWKGLGMGILREKDERKRAAMLCDCLTERGKSTIILDDVWEHFDLKKVGIPVREDGIKLVLTTRSIEVCRKMRCQEMINIEPLSHGEAESLFLRELEAEVALDSETNTIMKSIVQECAGLPLAIITMATTMRAVTDVFEWKDCLKKLRDSDVGETDMEKAVLKKLALSYDRLGKYEVQQCFLSCALYPEDQLIDKFELIEFFIDQGLIDLLETREEQYNRGLTILNKLQNVCLLEDHGREMKMHDLIRDMALHIMGVTSMVNSIVKARSIVRARKGLRSIPSKEYWTDALEKVSLVENEIGEFPLNMSPNCPKLSIFLMNENYRYDVVIPDSFFKQLQGLEVLNLSGCNLRELPDSISDLVNLRALLLRKCTNLCGIPYLGKLRSLRKLDIYYCKKVEALEGLEKLVDLRYLDISFTCIKQLPKGTLGALLNLQYLNANAINVEGIAKLRALETLACFLEDVDDFNEFVRMASKQGKHWYNSISVDPNAVVEVAGVEVTGDAQFGHCRRTISIKSWGDANRRITSINSWSHAIVSAGRESSGSGICILIPQDVKDLEMFDCDGATNLSDMGPLEDLEELSIGSCKNLRMLCGGQDEEVIDIHNSPAPLRFPRLRDLFIYRCSKLKYLFGHGLIFSLQHLQCITIEECDEMVGITVAVRSSPPHLPPAFPNLERIYIHDCVKMKRVMEPEWLPDFPNLKSIQVLGCDNMEEIIGGPLPYMPVEEISLEDFRVLRCDNLRRLFPHELLSHLRNLQSVQVSNCKGMVEMISGARQDQEGGIMTSINNTPSSFQSSISLPKLNTLWLTNLPQLKSVCEDPITCYSMEKLFVWKCPELNRIPLQLQLRDIKDLPFINMEGEETWKMLIWDHPNAQAILQPHVRVWGIWCTLGRKRN